MPDAAHAVVILAAGGSRRLGQPKQLLSRGGESLLRRCVRLAAASAPARLLVVLGADAERMEAELDGLACQPLRHPHWQQGMHLSLQAAAPQVVGFARVLVLACDQPALEAPHLRTLLDGAAGAVSGCAATLGEDGAPGIPAVVPGEWFTRFGDVAPDRGFGARLRARSPATLSLMYAPELAIDVDTPAQLERARALGLVDR